MKILLETPVQFDVSFTLTKPAPTDKLIIRCPESEVLEERECSNCAEQWVARTGTEKP